MTGDIERQAAAYDAIRADLIARHGGEAAFSPVSLAVVHDLSLLLADDAADPLERGKVVLQLEALLPPKTDGERKPWHLENFSNEELLLLHELIALGECEPVPEGVSVEQRDSLFEPILAARDAVQVAVLSQSYVRSSLGSGQFHYRHRQDCALEVMIVVEGKPYKLSCPICNPSAEAIALTDLGRLPSSSPPPPPPPPDMSNVRALRPNVLISGGAA